MARTDSIAWQVVQAESRLALSQQRQAFAYIELNDDKVMHFAMSLKLNCKGLLPRENDVVNVEGTDMFQNMVQTMKANNESCD